MLAKPCLEDWVGVLSDGIESFGEHRHLFISGVQRPNHVGNWETKTLSGSWNIRMFFICVDKGTNQSFFPRDPVPPVRASLFNCLINLILLAAFLCFFS